MSECLYFCLTYLVFKLLLFCTVSYCHLCPISQKQHSFHKKNIIEHKMCVLIFCTNFV